MTTESDANTVGNYRLIAELGQGGMADVFLAVVRGPAGFNKLRVVKRLRPHLADEPEFLAMFLDEARLAAKLNHPNVVQTIEVGQEGNRYYIAMEYLDGQPLHRIIHRATKKGGMSLAMRIRIVQDMLLGLHHAHEAKDFDGTPLNIVHRDVTPHNVFVTYDGQVKIVDFGIAKAVDSSTETRAGVVKGKVAYMAPEQAMGGKVDRRADIFAAGVMLWEAVTGQRMWKGLSQLEILQRVSHGRVPSAKSVNPEVPDKLDAICRKATARRLEDRYATSQELHAAIEQACDELGFKIKPREIGAFVAEIFDDKREAIRNIVEQQLAQIRANPDAEVELPGALPAVNTTADHTLPRTTTNPGTGSIRTISESGANSAPSMPTGSTGSTGTGTSTNAAVLGPRRVTHASGGKKGSLIAIGVLAAIAAGSVIWVTARKTAPTAAARPQPAPQAEAAPAAPAPAAPAPEAPTQPAAAPSGSAKIVLKAEPPTARFLLDEQPLEGNPYEGTVKLDGQVHTIHVKANGFETESRTVTFGQESIEEQFTLLRLAKGALPGAGIKTTSGGGKKPPTGGTGIAKPAASDAPVVMDDDG